MKTLRLSNLQQILELIKTGSAHWLALAPVARSHLRRWKLVARSIPDPTLRGHALHKLTHEALNPEAAAFFAVLAPRPQRATLVSLIVAYQAMYDYLDAVNEPHNAAPLRNGLRLHTALTRAVAPRVAACDHYAHNPQRDDAGYLKILEFTCRDTVQRLPSIAANRHALEVAARRCGEAQARNHAILTNGPAQLIAWSKNQDAGNGYLWWELAAAGISCLAIHALFAQAATPAATGRDAQRVHNAYFPSVCAISALLDSLIDMPADAATPNHRFAAHYRSSELAAERYEAIVADADDGLRALQNPDRHKIILAGIIAYYLSAREANHGLAESVKACLSDTAVGMVKPTLVVMRIRRRATLHRIRQN